LNALVAGVTWFENYAILNNPKDMSAGLQITGWPAHDSSISSILFGPDETSIFSLGCDGKASTINLMLFMFCEIDCKLHSNEFFINRFLSGACKIKAKSCGQETVVGIFLV